jgi:hypothetical protein
MWYLLSLLVSCAIPLPSIACITPPYLTLIKHSSGAQVLYYSEKQFDRHAVHSSPSPLTKNMLAKYCQEEENAYRGVSFDEPSARLIPFLALLRIRLTPLIPAAPTILVKQIPLDRSSKAFPSLITPHHAGKAADDQRRQLINTILNRPPSTHLEPTMLYAVALAAQDQLAVAQLVHLQATMHDPFPATKQSLAYLQAASSFTYLIEDRLEQGTLYELKLVGKATPNQASFSKKIEAIRQLDHLKDHASQLHKALLVWHQRRLIHDTFPAHPAGVFSITGLCAGTGAVFLGALARLIHKKRAKAAAPVDQAMTKQEPLEETTLTN